MRPSGILDAVQKTLLVVTEHGGNNTVFLPVWQQRMTNGCHMLESFQQHATICAQMRANAERSWVWRWQCVSLDQA